MDQTQQSHSEHTDWLRKGPLGSHLDAYTGYLTERGYARRTIDGYLACLAHFLQWAHRRRQHVRRIDEAFVAEFLDEHLPRCNCAGRVRSSRPDLRAALGHLLVVHRASLRRVHGPRSGSGTWDAQHGDVIREDAHLVRRIRNKFAHTKKKLHFDSTKIAALVEQLSTSEAGAGAAAGGGLVER